MFKEFCKKYMTETAEEQGADIESPLVKMWIDDTAHEMSFHLVDACGAFMREIDLPPMPGDYNEAQEAEITEADTLYHSSK